MTRYNWTIVESGIKHHNLNPPGCSTTGACVSPYLFAVVVSCCIHRSHLFTLLSTFSIPSSLMSTIWQPVDVWIVTALLYPRCIPEKNKNSGLVWFMVFNATFNNISVISWRSVLLVEETGVPRENHWPVARHWQTLSHNVVSSTSCHERGSKSHL